MAKALISTGIILENQGILTVSYTCGVQGPPNYAYSSDFSPNFTLSLAVNLTNWKNKVIAQAAERGVTLLASDVIVLGAPS